MILILQLLLALTLSVRTGGYYSYSLVKCHARSSDLSDAEYIYVVNFNKSPLLQFNSTVGKYVGFNEYGIKTAELWNSGPELQQAKADLDEICKPGLQVFYLTILDKTVQPKIQLRSEQSASGGHPAMLMCSAYDFYPKTIDVYWLRDGQKVTSDVVSTEEMANGDWYYQVHSHLEYTPTSGEKISCVVDTT
ncbi:hypothetical protein MHYP_G00348410 [Metynnis hypsauchen]